MNTETKVKETDSKPTSVENEKKTVTTEPEPAVEAIEEDDEFDEFDPCRWDAHDEDAEDALQWQVS